MFGCFIKKIAIIYAMRRPAPATIPLSFPRAANNDFFSIDLYCPDGNRRMWVRNSISDEVIGVSWVNEEPQDETIKFNSEEFGGLEMKATYYFNGYEFSYGSPFWFLFCCILGLPKLQIMADRAKQGFFNKKNLAVYERMELLRWMVNRSLDERNRRFSPTSIASDIHTGRWFHHPDRSRHQNYMRLILDSLVESGDLIRADATYMISSRSIATLDEYERVMQMHDDSLRNSKTANVLALLVVVATILGIAVDYFN